jgi:ParB family transcriptional regulator, chromosome partitioning protein
MAKTPKHGLGRGLDALMGGEQPLPESDPGDQVLSIRLQDIDVNRDQPRRSFDEESLRELSDSIRSVGVVQPILVQRAGARYSIIAGERRFRAARMAGLNEIPAIVRDYDATQRLEIALIENLQREDLNPVEEAMGVRALIAECGYTQEQAAQRLGKSRPAIANLLRLLTLPEPVLDMLKSGMLSAGHARALAGLSSPEAQVRLANLTRAQGLSVRQLERICQQQAEAPEKKPRPRPAGELMQLETMARDVFGTRAKLEGDASRGRLILTYFSAEDLERIWDVLDGVRNRK